MVSSRAYFSKTIALAEYNYEIYDKEILAVVKSLDQWRPELQGIVNQIQIYTDHKALEYFMTTKQLTIHQARQAEALSEYYFMIMYQPGKQNTKADTLTQRDDETKSQDRVKTEYRTCVFLSQDQVDPQVLQDLGIDVTEIDMSPVEEDTLDESVGLIDQILQANHNTDSLGVLQI